MKAALETKQEEATAGQFLTFFIAGEEYAASILKVREVIEYDTLTAVPNTPVWIRGVVNVRGSVLPVVDLGVKFGLPPSTISRFSCIVITEVDSEGDKLTLGVLADSVSRVIEFADVETAATAVKRFLKTGDVVLLKASRTVRLERIAETLKAEKS